MATKKANKNVTLAQIDKAEKNDLIATLKAKNILIDGRVASGMQTLSTLQNALRAALSDTPAIGIEIETPVAPENAPAEPTSSEQSAESTESSEISENTESTEQSAESTIAEPSTSEQSTESSEPASEDDSENTVVHHVLNELPWQHYIVPGATFVHVPTASANGWELYFQGELIDACNTLSALHKLAGKKIPAVSVPAPYEIVKRDSETDKRHYMYMRSGDVRKPINKKGEAITAEFSAEHLSCVDYWQSLRHTLRLAGTLAEYQNPAETTAIQLREMNHRLSEEELAARAAAKPANAERAPRAKQEKALQSFSFKLGDTTIVIEAKSLSAAQKELLARVTLAPVAQPAQSEPAPEASPVESSEITEQSTESSEQAPEASPAE